MFYNKIVFISDDEFICHIGQFNFEGLSKSVHLMGNNLFGDPV